MTAINKAVTLVVIVDDHPVVREGLALLIAQHPDLRVCGTAGSADEAITVFARCQPQAAIIDLSLGASSGTDLIRQLHQDYPDTRLLVFTMHEESVYAERAMRAGAAGYVMKKEGHEKVIEALRQITSGKLYISDSLRDRMWRQMVGYPQARGTLPEELLSDRELAVFCLLGQGLTTQVIADSLRLSPKTIQTYRNNIKDKLALENAVELTQRAVLWHTGHQTMPP